MKRGGVVDSREERDVMSSSGRAVRLLLGQNCTK